MKLTPLRTLSAPFTRLARASIATVLVASACGSESETPDAGPVDAGPSHHCPTYDGPKVDGTGLFDNEPFTLACRFDKENEEARFTTGARQGYIQCKPADANGITFTIDVRSEPSEGTYSNADVVHVRATTSLLSLRGDAMNVTKHVVEISCWNPETLTLGGSFDAEWFDDGSPELPSTDPAAFTAAGALKGTFMVRFNER
ncbi:MAG: hypothetical protein HYV07_06585 [Deltaproteobacteria bacterium]|nr:hypothetical protein [Deltaproteobacteria bacterium]